MPREQGPVRFPDPDYPAHCPPASHTSGDLPSGREKVCLHGRLVALEERCGSLRDAAGEVVLRWEGEIPELRCGDILSVEGWVEQGELVVDQCQRLVPARAPLGREGDWQRFAARAGRIRQNLQARAVALAAIRSFFNARGFLEVETPALVRAPGLEAHLQLFQSEFRGARRHGPVFLISSPEHQMKRLLGSGFERIFQIGRCFRNGERSHLHNPEFTMLEWYRAYAGYEEIMADAQALVVHVVRTLRGTAELAWQGQQLDLEGPWPRITVEQAFRDWAGIDLRSCATAAALRARAWDLEYGSVTSTDNWEEIFFKILIEKVEPGLRQQGAVFLKDYPACLGALAKLKAEDPAVAERVEVYVGGLELANGFTELNDPVEQRQRFLVEQRRGRQGGNPDRPLDEEFLAMLEQGMPPSGGMALGVDRLVMLLVGALQIDEVLAFPFAI